MNLIKYKIVHVELLLLICVVMSFTMISGVGATMPNDDIVGDGINLLTIQNDSEQKLLSTNFICIVLTEKQYNAAATSKDGIVRLVIPQDKFVIVQVPSKSEVSIPSDIINRSKLPNNEKIIVLWVPLPLISYNVVEEDVVLSAPENFFNTYESLSDLLQVAKKDYMNIIEIDQFIPAETYFNNPIPDRQAEITLPITLYGKDYLLLLKRMNFENIDDGIDSYEGMISGIDDSHVVLTADMDNILCGFISYPGEYITISAIQASENSRTTGMPLHIVYSEYDMLQPDEPIEFCGVKDQVQTAPLSEKIVKPAGSNSKGPYDTIYVDVLVITDNALHFSYSNWITPRRVTLQQQTQSPVTVEVM